MQLTTKKFFSPKIDNILRVLILKKSKLTEMAKHWSHMKNQSTDT